MGIVAKIEHALEWFDLRTRYVSKYVGERKNIHVKRKLYQDIILLDNEKNEINSFFKKNYGKKISHDWHRLYQSYTNIFRKDYFPEYLYSERLEPILNGNHLVAEFLGDKNMLPVLFSGIPGIHIPNTFCSCVNGLLRNEKNEMVNKEDITLLLENKRCVVKKSIDTSSGRDVQLCSFENGLDMATGKSVCEIIDAFGKNFVVQEMLKQSHELSVLYPNAINTFRVMSYILDNKVYVCPIALRLGRNGANRDNIHYGGIGIGLHQDGTLCPCAYSEYGEKFYSHPDTKITFMGYKAADFHKLEKAAKQLHAHIPWLKILSWDLSIDDVGNVSLLEVNTIGQGVWFPQMVNGMPLFGENTGALLQLISSKTKNK
jgi:hypothetical protein